MSLLHPVLVETGTSGLAQCAALFLGPRLVLPICSSNSLFELAHCMVGVIASSGPYCEVRPDDMCKELCQQWHVCTRSQFLKAQRPQLCMCSLPSKQDKKTNYLHRVFPPLKGDRRTVCSFLIAGKRTHRLDERPCVPTAEYGPKVSVNKCLPCSTAWPCCRLMRLQSIGGWVRGVCHLH
jgi:hypothetical protein